MNKQNHINLRDYVNEKLLLEQFGKLYNCEPGYGHNPFTRLCYPIPSGLDLADFSLLGAPEKQDDPLSDEEDTDLKQDTADLYLDLADMLSANPLEVISDCWTSSPYMFLAGILTGTGATNLAIKGVWKSLTFAIRRPVVAVLLTKPVLLGSGIAAAIVALTYAAALVGSKMAIDKIYPSNNSSSKNEIDNIQDAIKVATDAYDNGLDPNNWEEADRKNMLKVIDSFGDAPPVEEKYSASACFSYAMAAAWAMKKGATGLTKAGWRKFVSSSKVVHNSLKSIINTSTSQITPKRLSIYTSLGPRLRSKSNTRGL
mgnify:FL=1